MMAVGARERQREDEVKGSVVFKEISSLRQNPSPRPELNQIAAMGKQVRLNGVAVVAGAIR
jgi:hypothetical protein